jgi:peptide/nickel transport system permease protein/oligopeptide transport system permease protein
MARYVLGRVAQLIPVLLLVSALVFAIMHIVPGDPAELMLAGAEGGAITPQRLAELRQQMGLDEPLLVQYGRFVAGAVTGDLGQSVRYRVPVTGLILERFTPTLQLSLAGLALSVLIGVPLGIAAAIRPNSRLDLLAMGAASLGAAMPIYWVGLVLILLFSFQLGWFPPAGADSPAALVLPALTLALVSAGMLARLVRSSMIEILSEDFIRAARAKGIGERLVVWRHGLNNAMIPVVTMLGLQFGAMLAGAVVTEIVFSRPGIGRLVVTAILQKDYPLVQGCIVFLASVYLLVNLAVDIAYAWLDPRIRYGT